MARICDGQFRSSFGKERIARPDPNYHGGPRSPAAIVGQYVESEELINIRRRSMG
jgi:hypothetical protein